MLLSCYAGYLAFSKQNSSGDNPEKIDAFEAALATGLKTGDFIPAWLSRTGGGLSGFANREIAGAKFRIAEEQFVQSLSSNRVDDYKHSALYVWLPRPSPSDYETAEKPWVMNTPLAYCLAVVKWGIPALIFGWMVSFLVLMATELVWYFFLDRLKEIAATVRGK